MQQKKQQKQQQKQQQQLQQQLQQQHLCQFHFNLSKYFSRLGIPNTKYSESTKYYTKYFASTEILSRITDGCTKTLGLSIPNRDYLIGSS